MNTPFVICYGDSNTAGFDPRDLFGETLPSPWCSILEDRTGWHVYNLGISSQRVPRLELEYMPLVNRLRQIPDAILFIMLGTNDILCGYPAELTAQKMHAMVLKLQAAFPPMSILLAAPPNTALPGFQTEMRELAEEYQRIAEETGIFFVNPQEWDIPMFYDGIHFSEEGHAVFAERIEGILRRVMDTE